MKPIIAVVNNKGGVGKTFITLNLASVFADRFNTLMIDTDPQNNIATTLYDHIIEDIEKQKTIADLYSGKAFDIIKVFPDEYGKGVGKKLYLLPGNRQKMRRLGHIMKDKKEFYTILKSNEELKKKMDDY